VQLELHVPVDPPQIRDVAAAGAANRDGGQGSSSK
jgi:hypothetical protein